jgi:hypothetical protein
VSFDELACVECEDRVAPAEGIDPGGVFVLRKIAAHVAFAQAANLVLVQIADKIAHKAGTGMERGTDTVAEQLLEDVAPVLEPFRLSHPASR